MVAFLTRRFGDLDIAEEAAAEAFATAVARWPADGVPPNPGAWLTTTAARKAIDRIRRESKRDGKQREAQLLHDDDAPESLGAIEDDRLRLIFTCCHPALALEARVALTLRMVGGLTVPEIARSFLVQEAAMGQRITRAKAKIKAARIPYRVPSAEDLPARVSGVLAVLFLVFNEGYLATGPDTDPVRHDLTSEAIRLTRLIRALMPEDGEAAGLLALMLLTEARRAARISASGELVPLGEQDRGAWDAALIAEGHALVRERLAAGTAPGRYQILAAINAVHTSARDIRDTDWSQIVALYDQLVRLDPSPIVALNRAIAIAELDGPEVALADVDRLGDALAGYHAYHATRADLLRRLGRTEKSRTAYDRAIELAGNTAETAYLTRRRDQLAVEPRDGLRLHLEKDLAASPERVFAAFEADRLRQWWGPAGFTVPGLEFDVSEGAGYRITMQPPNADAFYLRGTFRSVEAPERLVFTFAWEEPDPDDQETLVTLTFAPTGTGTRIVLDQAPFKTTSRRDLHRDGWTETLERLRSFLG